MMGGPESTAGSLGNLAGGVGGAMLGRTIGAGLGSFGGPLGMMIGSVAGAAFGQWLGDLGGTSKELASVGAEAVGTRDTIAQAQLGATTKLVAAVETNTREVVAGNYIQQRGVSATSDLAKITKDKDLYG